jgi:hypothetical protein
MGLEMITFKESRSDVTLSSWALRVAGFSGEGRRSEGVAGTDS